MVGWCIAGGLEARKTAEPCDKTGFLLGGLRRGAAIKALGGSPDPAGVLALVEALSQDPLETQGDPLYALSQPMAEANAGKVVALWAAWAGDPKPVLAGVPT